MGPSDSELLGRCRDGDRLAAAQVLARYHALVYAVALRRTADRHLAEDVTQSVFELFLRRAASLHDNVRLGGWLATTAHLVAQDAIRKRQRRLKHEQRAAALTPDVYCPVDLSVAAEVSRGVVSALAELGEIDRKALCLRFHEELSVVRVGECLGVSPCAAAKRVSRALVRLRRILERRSMPSPAEPPRAERKRAPKSPARDFCCLRRVRR